MSTLQRPFIVRLVVSEDESLSIGTHFEKMAIRRTPLRFERIDSVVRAVQLEARGMFVYLVAGIAVNVDREGHARSCGTKRLRFALICKFTEQRSPFSAAKNKGALI